MNNKQKITIISSAVIILLIAIFSVAFAFYDGNYNIGNMKFSGNLVYSQNALNLTYSGATSLSLTVDTETLGKENASNDYTSFSEGNLQRIDINLTIDPNEYPNGATCTYNIYYTPQTVYNTSQGALSAGLHEVALNAQGDIAFTKPLDGINQKTLMGSGIIKTNNTTNQTVDLKYLFYNLNVNQNGAMGKEARGTISFEAGECGSELYNFGEQLLARDDTTYSTTTNAGLVKNEVYGNMFRYQSNVDRTCSVVSDTCKNNLGTYFNTEDNTNNYVCFGYNNASDCTGTNKDDYLYRIIGIDKDTKEVQVIKATGIKEGTSTSFKYHKETGYLTDWGAGMTNPQADIAMRLNGTHTTLSNIFVNSTQYPYMAENSTWYNKISSHNWKSGILGGNQSTTGCWSTSTCGTGATAYNAEASLNTTPAMKIGLLNNSDVLWAFTGGSSGSYTVNRNSWLYSYVGSVNSFEWAALRISSGGAWRLYGISRYVGYLSDNNVPVACRVRPSFFLEASITVSKGNGEINNPFIIEDTRLASKLMNDPSTTYSDTTNAGLVKNEVYGNMFRYQSNVDRTCSEVSDTCKNNNGTYFNTEDNTNNYVCFGYNNASDCTGTNKDDYLYRIIGIDKDTKEVQVIKATGIKEGSTTTFAYHNSQVLTDWGAGMTNPQTDIAMRLNGTHTTLSNVFVNSTQYPYMAENSTWYNKISSHNWKSGILSYDQSTTACTSTSTCGTGATAYNAEASLNTTPPMKIGLLNNSDVLWTFTGGNSGSYEVNRNSWLYSDVGAVNSSYEWTALRSSSGYAWRLGGGSSNVGRLGSGIVTNAFRLRPSFYLISDISWNGGSGTKLDPFTVE